MATRLATARNNFITVTAVKNDDEQDANTSIGSSSTTSTETCTTTAEIQRTQLTPVALHHVNLSQVRITSYISTNPNKLLNLHHAQKKIILQTAPSGSVSVIDVVPLESSDSSDSQIIVAEQLTTSPGGQVTNGQQVTAQVAVVQAQGSPNSSTQFITFSGKLCEYFCRISLKSLTLLSLSLVLIPFNHA